MTRVSRKNSAANSMRGESSYGAADRPVIKNGTSSDATPSMFQFLDAAVNAAATLLFFSYT